MLMRFAITTCFFCSALCWYMVPALADALEGKKSSAEILTNAGLDQWRDIDPAQLMIIELERGQVTIELSDIFAPNHVAQMKKLVTSGFYDGLSFYRVIDGFVAQGGDVFEKRELPIGAKRGLKAEFDFKTRTIDSLPIRQKGWQEFSVEPCKTEHCLFPLGRILTKGRDGYAFDAGYIDGFPVGLQEISPDTKGSNIDPKNNESTYSLIHCTGMMAMARDTEKDTGGTEFYITLQPQRYLDRNLTVFGKVIDGMEHLQALKRQPAPSEEGQPLGDIIVRAFMGDQISTDTSAPQWQTLRTDTQTFLDYVNSRRNRPEAFFYHRADYVDVCQLPIPVRKKSSADKTE